MADLVSSVDDLGAAERAALRRLVLGLADSKRLLGIRFSDWLLGAPSIESGIAASSMAQDEWGHARLLYAMLKDFGEDPKEVEHDRAAEDYASMPALDREFTDWAEVVAAMVVIDGAISAVLTGFSEGSYEAARSRVPKMLGEEEFHRDMGLAWLRRMNGASAEGRARMAEALSGMLSSTMEWMAPGDEASATLATAGLAASSSDCLARFAETYAGPLSGLGVEIPTAPSVSEGWGAGRGRGAGTPDEDAIQRARGDLNRMLFVE